MSRVIVDTDVASALFKDRVPQEVFRPLAGRSLGITFVHVTHSQEEAMALADIVVVMNDGRIEQAATPREVFERPATAFVAGFVGSSNLISAASAQALLGRSGRFAIRPEKIRLGEPTDKVGADEHSALGRIKTVVYLGAETRFIIALDIGGELMVTQQNLRESSVEALAAQGRAVRLTWKRGHVLTLADEPQAATA